MSQQHEDDDFDELERATDKIGGIFAGDAVEKFDRPQTKVKKDGYYISHHCVHCHRFRNLLISYPELVGLKYGIEPHFFASKLPLFKLPIPPDVTPWHFDAASGRWYPHNQCVNCGKVTKIAITQREAGGILDNASAQGYINPQSLQVYSNAAAQIGAQVAQQQQQQQHLQRR